ncbi:MAG: Ig-like domain-containing protein [Candidatus Eremiobacteraeota bacterium]|nr:Ig-like domain-containing protein [Candidatus Eremiobacteraeota bacterium]MCW5866761.1 Ig-like domain-containing protein [Candidatus Eremiobacteraeota bacterium]
MNTSRRLVASALTFGLGLTFWGCSTDTITDQPVPGFIPVNANFAPGTVSPLFDPTSGNPATIPLPNDLLRDTGAANAANKGLVNQFPTTGALAAEPFTSLRTMRGFSTSGNILIPFTGQVDAASVNAGSVLLVEGPPSTAADADTGAGTNATIQCNISVVNGQDQGTGNSTIVLQPVLPLKPATNYYVVVTNGIQGNGRNITSGNITTVTKVREPLISPAGNTIFPVPDASAQALEPLRAFYQNVWARAEAITGRDRSEIPLVFRFGTQPVSITLRSIRATLPAPTVQPRVVITGGPTPPFFPSVAALYAANGITGVDTSSIASISTVNITMTNFIQPTTGSVSVVTTDSTTGAPNGVISVADAPIGNFSGSGIPGDPALTPQGTKIKTAYLIEPAGTAPTGGWPVTIFQHGITRNKGDVLAIAPALTSRGFAVIAIDLVGHGDDVPATTPLLGDGALFINLSYLRNSRDNIRQSVVNLFQLTAAIKNQSFGTTFSTANPTYVGQSLGGIVGTVYTSTEYNNQFAVLNVAGGRISNLLLNSAALSPRILFGLAAQGVTPGTANFTNFFLIAQTVVDDADPFNYAAPALTGAFKDAPTSRSQVLQQEVIGDPVVPNSASRDLARAFAQVPTFKHVRPVVEAFGLAEVDTTATLDPSTAYQGSGLFQFPNPGPLAGQPTRPHGFLLSPLQGNAAAGQTQVVLFLATAISPLGPRIINPLVLLPKLELDWSFDQTLFRGPQP